MEISKYTRIVDLNTAEYCLFNTTNGSLVRIPKAYFNGNVIVDSALKEDEKEILLSYNMLASSDSKIIQTARDQYSNESETLNITIELTRECNLHCSYCYENGLKNSIKISKSVIENIFIYICNVVKRKRVKRLKVSFMGGEPLLAKKELIIIYNMLDTYCAQENIEMKTIINTNGVLLDKDFLELFHNLDVSITLSNKEDHDNVRAFINGSGSYDIICERLMECKGVFKRKDINLYIRFNTNDKNYLHFGEFLDELGNLNVDVTRVEPMYTNEHAQNEFKNLLSKSDFIYWNSTTAIDELISRSYKIFFAPQTFLQPCKAYINDNCKIYANGQMCLCDASDYLQGGPSIETVNQSQGNLFNDFYKNYKTWNPFLESQCSQCEKIFSCGGNYFCRKDNCDFERYNLDEFIKKFIEYSDLGFGKMFVNM